MKLRELRITGFGRLADRTFRFGDGLTIVVGPNEAGKSTLAAAVVASLYGLGRGGKERWRPWAGAPYATQLRYTLDDGRTYEVRRDFERDRAGVRVHDDGGRDAAAEVADGRTLAPGEVHLGLPLEAFVNAACVRQRLVAVEEGKAGEAVAAALARALDGGPREDAAIGALGRLDAALRTHVGAARATKNHPLRALRRDLDEARARAAAARNERDALAELRERFVAARSERDRLLYTAEALRGRVLAARASHLIARLERVHDVRTEIAEIRGEVAAYDDVATFPADRVAELEDIYRGWSVTAAHAESAAREAAEMRLTAAQTAELRARRADAGSVDDVALAALREAAAAAHAARARSDAALADAARDRRESDGGRARGGMLVIGTAAALALAVGSAIGHWWAPTAIFAAMTAILAGCAAARASERNRRLRAAAQRQAAADGAVAAERAAAAAVAAVLEPLGIATFDELERRRARLDELGEREAAARRCAERAASAARTATADVDRLNALAHTLVPDLDGDARDRLIAARLRGARRRERDGLAARLQFLELQRDDALAGEDAVTLERELAELLAAGVTPETGELPLRALERERDEVEAHARESERRCAVLEGELRAGDTRTPDIAALDDAILARAGEVARLEAFQAAVLRARSAVDRRKDEVHRAFARRLADYAAATLADVTGGRYAEVMVDATTLVPRVRVPETGAIESLDSLSSGARDQVYLVIRFAMARMFAEGGETPPLLLDDPFAYWDDERIARCVPVLTQRTLAAQAVVLTTSTALADAAVAAGAARIDLAAPRAPALTLV